MPTEPSKGAGRAAHEVYEALTGRKSPSMYVGSDVHTVATIIDRETKTAELVECLRDMVTDCELAGKPMRVTLARAEAMLTEMEK